ncbi:MAG TPA: acetyl-CoA decarbonylase/synthase complex subunit delta [Actinobacteria bacterium]|nr:acetyl-CoA decarbonylase/synthase complex subunit delta [Actinomycetota bacterium]
MAFQAPIDTYQGKIREVIMGGESNQITVGGEIAMPFHFFEGEMSRKPVIAMEVYDVAPDNWSSAVAKPFRDVLSDPVVWAKKCQDEFGADMICLRLVSTDPNGENRDPAEAAETVKAVLEAISVPLCVYGSGNIEKDGEVLKKVAEVTEGQRVILGPSQEDNYKPITAAAIGYKHNVSGLSPIDVNMAKQLNILMTQLGLEADRLVMDPSGAALGYGLEYVYSIMERLRLAALQQNDEMTQMPILCDFGREVWKAKEAKTEDEPSWGDPEKRGILWEFMTAASMLIAGGDVLVMRHPEAVKLTKKFIEELMS